MHKCTMTVPTVGERETLRRAALAVDRTRLSERELQVAAFAALGHTNKHIAYTLGLAASTVSSHLQSAMRRLGVRDVASLAALLVISFPVRNAELWTRLTQAEADVARLAIQGLSNGEIANRRGTRLRTVANQMASILHKLGMQSRRELAARWLTLE